ncbi:MAG: ABC transporter permease, partial [Planctomycetota bacterium]
AQIRASCPHIRFLTQVHQVREDSWIGGREIGARVLGVESRYFDVLGLRTVAGRRLCDVDNAQEKRVCNVGSRILHEERVMGNGLGMMVQVRDRLFRVVGVLDQPEYTERGQKALSTSPELLTIYLPAATALSVFGTEYRRREEGERGAIRVEVDQVVIGVKKNAAVLATADAVRQVLEHNHEERRDYEIIVPRELLEQEQKTQRVFAITMILIASVSLLVGGIGIINIMLATVTERTREIGIRRACGAKQLHIAYQFLIETTTLALIGGVIGAGVGVGAVEFIAPRVGWPAIVSAESLILALGISCAVGISFGTAPAIKAARMDPIRALRAE